MLKHYAINMYGEVGVKLHALLILALDGGEWSALCSGQFIPWERVPSTQWTEGWLGTGVGLDEVAEKNSCPAGNQTLTINFIASHFND
jgi:hypothetical protein